MKENVDKRGGLCLGEVRKAGRVFKKSPNLQNSKSPSNESNHSDLGRGGGTSLARY